MLEIWTAIVRYDCESEVSAHFTEGGALLWAINDIVSFLKADDDELFDDWERFAANYSFEPDNPLSIHDLETLKDIPPSDLWKIYNFWNEITWSTSYDMTISRVRLKA